MISEMIYRFILFMASETLADSSCLDDNLSRYTALPTNPTKEQNAPRLNAIRLLHWDKGISCSSMKPIKYPIRKHKSAIASINVRPNLNILSFQ